MFGVGLMLVGAILIAFALIMFLTGFGGIILGLLGALVRNIANGLFHIFNKRRINPEYVEHMESIKLAEKNAKIAKEVARKQAKQEEESNRVIDYAVRKAKELRRQYPLADEDLFSKYIDVFLTRTVDESDKIEDLIRRQHCERIKNDKALNGKGYDIEEIKKMPKISEKDTYTYKFTVYKNDLEYIMVLHTKESNDYRYYTSYNSFEIELFMQNMIDRCDKKYSLGKEVVITEQDICEAMNETKRDLESFK